MMFLSMKRKFVNISVKNIMQYMLKKSENARIIKIYCLNITNSNNLLIKLLFLLIYLFSLLCQVCFFF